MPTVNPFARLEPERCWSGCPDGEELPGYVQVCGGRGVPIAWVAKMRRHSCPHLA